MEYDVENTKFLSLVMVKSCMSLCAVTLLAKSVIVHISQIAGLTNNSYLEESREVRRCVRKYHGLGKYVLEVAKVTRMSKPTQLSSHFFAYFL